MSKKIKILKSKFIIAIGKLFKRYQLNIIDPCRFAIDSYRFTVPILRSTNPESFHSGDLGDIWLNTKTWEIFILSSISCDINKWKEITAQDLYGNPSK